MKNIDPDIAAMLQNLKKYDHLSQSKKLNENFSQDVEENTTPPGGGVDDNAIIQALYQSWRQCVGNGWTVELKRITQPVFNKLRSQYHGSEDELMKRITDLYFSKIKWGLDKERQQNPGGYLESISADQSEQGVAEDQPDQEIMEWLQRFNRLGRI
jgi:hypothetical protein